MKKARMSRAKSGSVVKMRTSEPRLALARLKSRGSGTRARQSMQATGIVRAIRKATLRIPFAESSPSE
jgi:hypothetical protein